MVHVHAPACGENLVSTPPPNTNNSHIDNKSENYKEKKRQITDQKRRIITSMLLLVVVVVMVVLVMVVVVVMMMMMAVMVVSKVIVRANVLVTATIVQKKWFLICNHGNDTRVINDDGNRESKVDSETNAGSKSRRPLSLATTEFPGTTNTTLPLQQFSMYPTGFRVTSPATRIPRNPTTFLQLPSSRTRQVETFAWARRFGREDLHGVGNLGPVLLVSGDGRKDGGPVPSGYRSFQGLWEPRFMIWGRRFGFLGGGSGIAISQRDYLDPKCEVWLRTNCGLYEHGVSYPQHPECLQN